MKKQEHRFLRNFFLSRKGYSKYLSGFTIVELLVVVVIIGVLASITVVAYRGISQKANDVKSQTELSSASKQLKLYFAENGEYPVAINSCPNPVVGSACLKNNPALNNYIQSPDHKGFCTSAKNGTNSFFLTSTTTPIPTSGDCLGALAMASTSISDNISTGATTWTVPPNVTLIHLEVWGAQGGDGNGYDTFRGGYGGYGGYGTGIFIVSPGDILNITVGSRGSTGSAGSESNVKKGGIFLTRGYGGGGGGNAYSDCDWWHGTSCWGEWWDYNGPDGSSGTGYVDSTSVTNSISSGVKNGNGRVLITYTPGEITTDYNSPQAINWTVPSSVVSVKLEAWGSEGGKGGDNGSAIGVAGGSGGYAKGILSVIAGDILNVNVGSKGAVGPYNGVGITGGESYVKKGASYLVRGYGGTGGQSSLQGCISWYYDGWEDSCDGWGPVDGTVVGSSGSGYVNTGLLTSTQTLSGLRSGNGRVLLTYQTAVSSPPAF